MRHSSLLELEKIGSQRHHPGSVNRPWFAGRRERWSMIGTNRYVLDALKGALNLF